jgi:hypothetical protein
VFKRSVRSHYEANAYTAPWQRILWGAIIATVWAAICAGINFGG